MAKRRKKSGKRKLIGALIFFLILLLALAAVLFIYPMLLPKINPFDYAGVVFTGQTGEGTAEVVLNTDLVGADASKITYTLSKNSGLIQGETVTLTAESRSYNLTETSKDYTVSGLDEYLRDAADLTDAAIMAMHEKSDAIIQMNLGDPSDSFGVKNEIVASEPVRVWLLTSEDENILYDVTRVSFKSHNGQIKKVFLIEYYKNVLINPSDPDSFQFETCMYAGDVVSLGDDAVNDGVVTGYATLKAAKEALIDSAGAGMDFTWKKLTND